MRALFYFMVAGAIAISLFATAAFAEGGISAADLRGFANALRPLPGRIQAIQIFGEPKRDKNSIAIATFDEQSGWQLFVYAPSSVLKYDLEWSSGKLDDSFRVASPQSFRTYSFSNGQGIVFEGCAPHVCPDVFSILLYVPSQRTALIASSVWGKVTYSPNAEEAKNATYKSDLADLVHKHQQ